MLAALDASEGTARIAAIDAVGMLGDTRADGYLIPLLTDDAAAVRTAAAYALMRAGSDHALEAVVARAREKDPDARRAVAAAIWRCAGVRKKVRTTKKTKTTKRTAPTSGPRFWTVQAGDTFGVIATKTGVPVATIQQLNPNVKSTSLFIGEKLRLR